MAKGQEIKQAQDLYELGLLYRDRSDFFVAIEKLTESAALYRQNKDYEEFLRCQNLLLRMYAEMENHKKITEIKETLQDIVIKEKVDLTSKTYYALGLCAAYKNQFKTSLEYLEKALALALTNDSKEDICYAINGLAIVYFYLGRLDDALKEVYNLQVFFQVLPMEELELSSKILNGHILLKMGKYEQALEVFWQSYDVLKSQKNIYMYVSLLYAMGVSYKELKENNLARLYLSLAKRSTDPENLKYLAKQIDIALDSLTEDHGARYDLVFNLSSSSVVEKRKGRVDFKNQFILLDMLRLFVQNPGKVYSKEQLVDQVWKQSYDPSVHDNKIYVTIKRLRKMIEPEYDKPKYIFRAKNGYYLNKETRVLLDN